jgi:hypothetical protein
VMSDNDSNRKPGHPVIRHGLRARHHDWDQGRRTSSGPADNAPRQQAGHMTGAANVDQNAKQALPRGRPHMTERAAENPAEGLILARVGTSPGMTEADIQAYQLGG